MSSKKKADLKSGLADILLDEDNESSLSKVMNREPSVRVSEDPVSLTPEHTVESKGHDRLATAVAKKLTTEPVDAAVSPPVVMGSHLAQKRILALEGEIDRLRTEAELMKASEEALKRQVQEVSERARALEARLRDNQDSRGEELKILKDSMHKKETDLQTARNKVSELESRLQNDFKRIRVKERELQNRIELLKLESSAVVKSKDELILELKRQLDQINYEMDSIRKKTQNINQQVEDQQDRIKRSVKALRLAISLLDGDESQLVLKKAE